MIIVQKSDFTGFSQLARSTATDATLQRFIDRYEKQYIQQIFGVELGNLLIADLIPSSITLVSQGNWDASGGTLPTAADTNPVVADILEGFYWTITVAGTINSVDYVVGDLIYATADTPSSSDWAKKEIRFTNIVDEFAYQQELGLWYLWNWYGSSALWFSRYWNNLNGIYQSRGLKDILVSLIYYNYVFDRQVLHSQSGATLNMSEVATTQTPAAAARFAEVNWNGCLDALYAIQWVCRYYQPDTYPEYKGTYFSPQFSQIL